MKNIVVPTDFSENADNALNYAINLANYFKSKIHLIHIYRVQTRAGMLVTARDFILRDAEEQLAKLVEDNNAKLAPGTQLEAIAIEGYTRPVITKYTNGIKADLIIMGMQGASGLGKIFMGSSTVSVIKNTDVPVLAIPSNCSYQPTQNITLAIDAYRVSSADVVRPLVKLAKTFNAHISLVHVEKEKIIFGIDDGIDNYLTEVDHSFHLVNNDNIRVGIDQFVEQNQSDLLCMIHRSRGIIGNLFHKSVVRKEAFDSPLPLLVLSDK